MGRFAPSGGHRVCGWRKTIRCRRTSTCSTASRTNRFTTWSRTWRHSNEAPARRSGDHNSRCRSAAAIPAAARVGQFSRLDCGTDRAPIDRLVAYLQRRLLRPTFQRAGEDQYVEREAPEPRVDLRHAHRGSAWVDGDSGAGRRRALFFRIRPGVCGRGPHRSRALALRLSQPAPRWRRQPRRGRARRLRCTSLRSAISSPSTSRLARRNGRRSSARWR